MSETVRKSAGREFHAAGPEQEKARSPNKHHFDRTFVPQHRTATGSENRCYVRVDGQSAW